ncbi:MAG: lipoyl synthase [Spirochaetales bacterium]|nr:lipoyl synthase [Spirochaetales bacterium]
MNHPQWFKIKLPRDKEFYSVSKQLKRNSLFTVCEEAKCPNRVQCYSEKRFTFLILGPICTRNCLYCGVTKGTPKEVDTDEPLKIAELVASLECPYLVITSVTRDDLPDQGAGHFAATIKAVKKLIPACKVEVLTPDFRGNIGLLKKVLDADPYVFTHNIEVVKELFSHLRPQGDYDRSLTLLEQAKKMNAFTKSGIMIGLGETKQQICTTLKDLKSVQVDALTIGQYLPPAKTAPPVNRYYTPDDFKELKKIAMDIGFRYVYSGPLVRSSSAHIEVTL